MLPRVDQVDVGPDVNHVVPVHVDQQHGRHLHDDSHHLRRQQRRPRGQGKVGYDLSSAKYLSWD